MSAAGPASAVARCAPARPFALPHTGAACAPAGPQVANNALPVIDFATVHVWPDNWGVGAGPGGEGM